MKKRYGALGGNMKIKKIIGWLVGVASIITLIVVMLTLTITSVKKENRQTLANAPDISVVEKDTKEIFMTDSVEVHLGDHDYDNAYYYVIANGILFRVLYTCEKKDFRREWVYVRYIPLKEMA